MIGSLVDEGNSCVDLLHAGSSINRVKEIFAKVKSIQ